MKDKEVMNAINTINTVYFFNCAKEQNLLLDTIIDYLTKKYIISRDYATELLFSVAPLYYRTPPNTNCLHFIEEHISIILHSM